MYQGLGHLLRPMTSMFGFRSGPGRWRSRGPDSCACNESFTTYWPPRHSITMVPTAAQDELKYLLGGSNQFCSSYFHVLSCKELHIPTHTCLHSDPLECKHQCVTLIAQGIDSSGNTILVARYTTCRRRNGMSLHAEEFMILDTQLKLLPANSSIVVYAQLQPCHHSSRADEFCPDATSCTESIIRWYNDYLEPKNISLTFRCANVYKAMWTFTDEEYAQLPGHRRYRESIGMAREGIRLLAREGIIVTSIGQEGWSFLTRLATLEPKPTEEQWDQRRAADAKISDLFREISWGDAFAIPSTPSHSETVVADVAATGAAVVAAVADVAATVVTASPAAGAATL
jgi:hypothetical protein